MLVLKRVPAYDDRSCCLFCLFQWRCWPRLVFVIFRLCLALYTGIICILTLVYFPHRNPQRSWIMWLTSWSYLVLTCHEIYAAAIVLVHSTDRTTGWCCRELEDGAAGKGDHRGTNSRAADRRRPDDPEPVPCYMKLEWLLFCTASPVAFIVTATNVFLPMSGPMTAKSLNNHFLNSVVILLDLCISALPVRLLHFVYATVFYTLYYLFTLIFWSFDHTGNVLYDSIDWDKPGDVMLKWFLTGLVLPLALQIILFLMYRLRLFIFTKIYGDEERGYEEIYDY